LWSYPHISATSYFIVTLLPVLCRELQTWSGCALWAPHPQKPITLRPQPGEGDHEVYMEIWWHRKHKWDDHWWRDVGPEFCKKVQAFSASFWLGTVLRSLLMGLKKCVFVVFFCLDSSFPITNQLRRGRPRDRYSISGRDKQFCLSTAADGP
jgi:hypothetical protein